MNRWIKSVLIKGEWIKKILCICNRILLSYKKEWNNAICGNMDESRDYHTNSEVREGHLWYHVRESNVMIQMNLSTKQTQTENKLNDYWRGKWWESGGDGRIN